MEEQIAKLRYLRVAPRKVRAVAGLLRGLSVNEAEAQLLVNPRRPAKPLLKLLRSAVTNAKNNKHLDPQKLFVKIIMVDQGPMLKRYLPRARGSASEIQKKMSHVTIILGENLEPKNSRFNIVVKKKVKDQAGAPVKSKAKKDKDKPALGEEKVTPSKAKESGVLKRVFTRKSNMGK